MRAIDILDSMSKEEIEDRYNVASKSYSEATTGALYDTITYPLAGIAEMSFFSLPRGQGATTIPGGAGGKTLADTNLTQASTLSEGVQFLITDIELLYIPGVAPSVLGAPAAAAEVNDAFNILSNGSGELDMIDKKYFTEAPIGVFAPQRNMTIDGAQSDQTTPAAGLNVRTVFGAFGGDPYDIDPVLIKSSTSFNFTVKFPVLVALTSASVGRMRCRLGGILFRPLQ